MRELNIVIEPLEPLFSICKVRDFSMVNLDSPFCFSGATDEEKSLVCPEDLVPSNVLEESECAAHSNVIEESKGWKGFRVAGQLDFSLVGILSEISGILAENDIGIFAVSTFNTDYIFVKEENFERALEVLRQ